MFVRMVILRSLMLVLSFSVLGCASTFEGSQPKRAVGIDKAPEVTGETPPDDWTTHASGSYRNVYSLSETEGARVQEIMAQSTVIYAPPMGETRPTTWCAADSPVTGLVVLSKYKAGWIIRPYLAENRYLVPDTSTHELDSIFDSLMERGR